MVIEAQHNLYNIPAERPFLKTFARYMLQQSDGDPKKLTEYKILLPTRRACRLLREIFLNMNDGQPILLPQLTPIGDVDEEDLSLMMFGDAQRFLDIPAAIAPLRRQLLLAQLIRKMPNFAQGADHALLLSKALCRFMDQVVVEGLDFSDLHKVVPDEFAEHWQITLGFLKIVSEHWPRILEEEQCIDVAGRRNLLLHTLSEFWKDSPPDYPVIAAGSTGSIPAVRELLEVIARLPQGQVVLPGFDACMDEGGWSGITESHAQYGFKQLLKHVGCSPADVKALPFEGSQDALESRRRLCSSMMLPAQKISEWKEFSRHLDFDALAKDVRYFSCTHQQEEAVLIALFMREALEDPKKTIALVTPDRGLARRVSAVCRRWEIEVDDSAGIGFLEARLGKFTSLCLSVVERRFDPISFLALLKFPFCRFEMEEKAYTGLLKSLETDILRSGDVIVSYEMLRTKIESEALLSFFDRYFECIRPLYDLTRYDDERPFVSYLTAHVKMMESLARTEDRKGEEILWRGDEGEAGSVFFSELFEQADLFGQVSFFEYQKILQTLARDVTIRSAYGVHPRVLILGQLEARLSDADIMILGGLNEGAWPSDVGHDPWMSRPMRRDFGLPASVQAIGIAAHDFAQGFCNKKVILTRSEKVGGSPTVPARWLDRLDTVLQAGGADLFRLTDSHYLEWARILDRNDVFSYYQRPAPRPPVSARLKGASVTKIEQWIQNPYAVYMHYILRLRKMRPLLQDNDAALRGTVLHDILDRFSRAYPVALPDDAEDRLIALAQNVLEEQVNDPDMLRYWWPRFLKIAAWFVAHEKEWRFDAKFLESEIKGTTDIHVDDTVFNLYGTADRIDRVAGGYAIIDYKSGGQYSKSKLLKGELPQLPLEALILSQGGFAFPDGTKVPAGDIKYLGYWTLTGGQVAGKTESISGDLDEAITTVLDGLKGMIAEFRKVETPFYAVPDTSNVPRFNDYEHVSRLKEWAALDAQVQEGDS